MLQVSLKAPRSTNLCVSVCGCNVGTLGATLALYYVGLFKHICLFASVQLFVLIRSLIYFANVNSRMPIIVMQYRLGFKPVFQVPVGYSMYYNIQVVNK